MSDTETEAVVHITYYIIGIAIWYWSWYLPWREEKNKSRREERERGEG
jgi:hypothetical protein